MRTRHFRALLAAGVVAGALYPATAAAQVEVRTTFRAGNPAPILEQLNRNAAASQLAYNIVGFTDKTNASRIGSIQYLNLDKLTRSADPDQRVLEACQKVRDMVDDYDFRKTVEVRHSVRFEDAWSFSGSVESQIGNTFGSHTKVNASYTHSQDRVTEDDTTYTTSVGETLHVTTPPGYRTTTTFTRYTYDLNATPVYFSEPVRVGGEVQYAQARGVVGLHRWYIPSNGPHQYYTTSWESPAGPGNVYQGIEAAIFPADGPRPPDTYPLVNAYVERDHARFLMIDDDRGLVATYLPPSIRTAMDTIGYVYREAKPGTVPVRAYYNGQHPVYLVRASEGAYVAANGFPQQAETFTFWAFPVQQGNIEDLGFSDRDREAGLVGTIRGNAYDWMTSSKDEKCN